MKSSLFWDITPCSPFKLCMPPAHAGFLLGLFDPEDGGDMFLQNVGSLSADNTVL
jgi:hypothetical protein